MNPYHQIVKGPIVTEKTHDLKARANKLTFKVDIKANKIEIRKVIEDVFKVKVTAVNTVRLKGKAKRLGRSQGVRPDWKKAIVTLAPGEKIAALEGL
jgi:large subunit ribosomal protein L23